MENRMRPVREATRTSRPFSPPVRQCSGAQASGAPQTQHFPNSPQLQPPPQAQVWAGAPPTRPVRVRARAWTQLGRWPRRDMEWAMERLLWTELARSGRRATRGPCRRRAERWSHTICSSRALWTRASNCASRASRAAPPSYAHDPVVLFGARSDPYNLIVSAQIITQPSSIVTSSYAFNQYSNASGKIRYA